MFEMIQLLASTNPLLLGLSVLIFDIPRYTFSLVSLALFGATRGNAEAPAVRASISVTIPTFNGGAGLEPSIASLHRQTLRPVEIIVVDDGSTDNTREIAERARALGLVHAVICHGTRCGAAPRSTRRPDSRAATCF
jgi:cellulose synthase/poly-beta-1,6-N-acetylglucosamine synthase-like glycosyltransferase